MKGLGPPIHHLPSSRNDFVQQEMYVFFAVNVEKMVVLSRRA